jgi:gas vesicle protein
MKAVFEGVAMTGESNEAQIAEEAPKSRSGLLPVLALSVLLGIVVIAGVIGAVVAYQSAKESRAELMAMKKEIAVIREMSEPKENSPALEAALKEMKHQIETLSGQINVLMASVSEHSTPELPTAKSAAIGDKNSESAPGNTLRQVPQGKEKPPEVQASTKDEAAPKKPDVRNCDLIGKSPEEQAAILKRCVSLIDPPDKKRAP